MDAQLNDQVTALLQAAGFTEITRMRGDTFLTISAVKGTTRAVVGCGVAMTTACGFGAADVSFVVTDQPIVRLPQWGQRRKICPASHHIP